MFVLPGCKTAGLASSVSIKDGPQATQSGADVAAGAAVGRSTSKAVLPLPAGSRIEIQAAPAPYVIEAGKNVQKTENNKPAPVAVTLAAPSSITVETTTQTATAPTTHAPPAPPTPAELATGAGVRLFYYLAAGLGLAALVLFYTGHGKAGGVALLGAAGLPLLAQFSALVASHVAVAVVTAAAALVVAWYLVRPRLSNSTP